MIRYKDTVKPEDIKGMLGKVFNTGLSALKEINHLLGFPVTSTEDVAMLEFYLIKIYRCGTAAYKFPHNKVIGRWDGKSFTFKIKSRATK